ncbi:GGDEF domain-containing protein [Mitsuaria sp. GD03876]|uniref:GGDEF domain-containing protein n=1 Tax=Mitsuaria sp. GD03876 TaxID=2975399 RepID=UPI00244C9DDC|nr:GGDEF domain-containing protein [Mitsuaria sp. GD03876]MDH0862934.1 GGDEF domain-containing protein [Mitsuaria sp. GD03876]
MIPAADPVSLIAALVALFGVAAVVWLMIAAGLRESPAACASVAGANAMLGGSFLLHEALGLTLPMHYWWSDLLSLAGIGLVRLAVPLIGDRPAPWRAVLATILVVGVATARFTGGPEALLHKLLLYGAMGALALLAARDAWRLLRARGLHARAALVLAAPLVIVGALLLARPVEALLAPGRTEDIDVQSAFNIAWLWASLVLALLINGWIAFLFLMKLVLEIRRLTERDPLTDALNRRALSEAVDAEHSRQMRGHGYALVLLDMDRFKQLNDTLGHAAGDSALKALVNVVKPCLREVDRLARLGGEEFCVLLPHTGIAGAALVAERMRALLAEHPFAWNGQSWSLTASFGIAESSAADASAAEVMRRADQALYRAKGQGRNVVQAVEVEPAR